MAILELFQFVITLLVVTMAAFMLLMVLVKSGSQPLYIKLFTVRKQLDPFKMSIIAITIALIIFLVITVISPESLPDLSGMQ